MALEWNSGSLEAKYSYEFTLQGMTESSHIRDILQSVGRSFSQNDTSGSASRGLCIV
jgi:hypothetical protein